MSNHYSRDVVAQHETQAKTKKNPSTTRKAKAEVTRELDQLIAEHGKAQNNIDEPQILAQNKKVKKGPTAPASGSGSPKSRQRLPQPGAGHEVTCPAEIRHPLPPLPKGLSWPETDYNEAPEFNKPGGVARYFKRVWKSLIPYIDMPTMREHYPIAAKAMDNHRTKLETKLRITTLPQLNDQVVSSEWIPTRDAKRVAEAKRRRMKKATATPDI
jgi:hypothetical protein